jgi:UDP-N-acetylmuramate-alanine ligase
VPGFNGATDAVVARAEEGDMILTLGAGSVSQLGPMILAKLQSKQTEPKELRSLAQNLP